MKFYEIFRRDVRDDELEYIKIESGSKEHQNHLERLF